MPVRTTHSDDPSLGELAEYEHSSASFYELNKITHYTPVHYMELQ